MSDRVYVVRSGDHLRSIAADQGLEADAIWNHPANAKLKQLRRNPNILCEGDVLTLPEPDPRRWLPVAVGGTNRFVGNLPVTTFSVTFAYDGKPLANERCIVHGLPPPNARTTDAAGRLALVVELSVRKVTVEFPRLPLVRVLRIGNLDPVTEPSGLRQRLAHLGYLAPRAADATDAAALERALRAFQRDQGLPETGAIDDATCSALERSHGC